MSVAAVGRTVPATGVNCEKCAAKGHTVQAVEYKAVAEIPHTPIAGSAKYKAMALCVFCRDGDPCPGCARVARQREIAGGTVTPAPKRSVRSTPRISFDQIKEELTGESPAHVFKQVDGISVRYPSPAELKTRTAPGPKPSESDRYLDLVQASPTKCAEFPCPKTGVSLHSFAARLSTRARRRGGRGVFSIWRDKKRNTVLIAYHPKETV